MQCQRLERFAQTKNRKLLHLVDNCSAHTVDYSIDGNVHTHFLPPNTTSALQPVDASAGRSLKATYRCLFVTHFLQYINFQLCKPAELQKPFKMTEAVTIYDAIKMMAEAWDMVPTTAILSGWKTVAILAPFQQQLVIEKRIEMHGKREPSMRAYSNNTVFLTDRTANAARWSAARILGDEFLKKNEREFIH